MDGEMNRHTELAGMISLGKLLIKIIDLVLI
jgi:hypothetical protein